MPVNLSNLAMSRVSAGTSGSTPPSDPYWNDVTFLMETALPNSITDATGKNTITNSGVIVSGAQYQVGTSSAYANGSSDLTAPRNDAAFSFGTGNFTMEGWFYLTADADVNPSGRRDATIMGCWPNRSQTWQIMIFGNASTTGTGIVFDSISGNDEAALIATTTINKNTWTYFAVVKNANTLTIYVNGVAINSVAWAPSVDSGGGVLRVACLVPGTGDYNNHFPGYLQQLRITKGVARYTADFTPPAQPFPTN